MSREIKRAQIFLKPQMNSNRQRKGNRATERLLSFVIIHFTCSIFPTRIKQIVGANQVFKRRGAEFSSSGIQLNIVAPCIKQVGRHWKDTELMWNRRQYFINQMIIVDASLLFSSISILPLFSFKSQIWSSSTTSSPCFLLWTSQVSRIPSWR